MEEKTQLAKNEDFSMFTRTQKLFYSHSSYVIIRVWHSNVPRLFHTQLSKTKRRLKDYGHVSIETYQVIDSNEGNSQENNNAQYQVVYMSMWRGSHGGIINNGDPFEFKESLEEDIEAIGRNPDVTVCLTHLNVSDINEQFRSLYENIEENPPKYRHEIKYFFDRWRFFQEKYNNIKIYNCSIFANELLCAGGIEKYFAYYGSTRVYHALNKSFTYSYVGALAGLSQGLLSLISKFCLAPQKKYCIDSNSEPEHGASSGEVIIEWTGYLQAFIFSFLAVKIFKNVFRLPQDTLFRDLSSSMLMGAMAGFALGFAAGFTGIEIAPVTSPSYIADMVLSAQKIEEIKRLKQGNTFIENSTATILYTIGYR